MQVPRDRLVREHPHLLVARARRSQTIGFGADGAPHIRVRDSRPRPARDHGAQVVRDERRGSGHAPIIRVRS